MASYKETVGTAVTNYAGNNPGVVTGELWYDSSNYVWKYQYPTLTTAGSWRTGNSMNTARNYLASATNGTQTAALGFGGVPPNTAITESYNGTNWTEVNDLNNAKHALAGGGTQTSAIAFGGGPSK